MSTNLKKKLKPSFFMTVAGLILALLLVVSVILLAHDSSEKVEEAVIEKMEIALSGQVHSIDLVVDSHYATLRSIANHLEENGGMSHMDHMTEWMDDIVEAGDFYRLSVTEVATDRVYYSDITGRGIDVRSPEDTYYHETVKTSSEWLINGPYTVQGSDQTTVVITVPVMIEDEITAIVSGMITTEDFLDLITTEGRDSGHAVYLVDSTGNIFIGSDKDNNLQVGGQLTEGKGARVNLLTRVKEHADILMGSSAEEFEQDLKNGDSGYIIFQADSYDNYGKGYLVYENMSYRDWTLVYAKNRTAVIEEFDAIQRENRLSMIAVILLCVVVVGTIIITYRRMYNILHKSNEELKKTSEKYRILEEYSKLESFEYHIKKKQYRFGAKLQRRFGLKEFTSAEDIEKIVHPEDLMIQRAHEAAMISGENMNDVEFRVKESSDGQYNWFRIHPIEVTQEGMEREYVLGYIFDVTCDMLRLQTEKEKADRDFLTGLYSRGSMIDIIKKKLESSSDETHILLLVDLDKFKEINDSLGHEAGDRALTDFADCMKGFFRKEDFIGRFGGDEFFVFLPSVKSIDGVLSRLESFCEIVTSRTQAKEWNVLGCSIGMAVYPQDGQTYEKLYREADVAMYKSKKKDGICKFTKFEDVE